MKHIDKAHHAVWSFALAVAGAFLLGPGLGLAMAAVLGLAKELYDGWSPAHTFDRWDLVANAVGLAMAFAMMGGAR